jgi:hypothetical protein
MWWGGASDASDDKRQTFVRRPAWDGSFRTSERRMDQPPTDVGIPAILSSLEPDAQVGPSASELVTSACQRVDSSE